MVLYPFCVFFTLSHIEIFTFSFPGHYIVFKSSVVQGCCLTELLQSPGVFFVLVYVFNLQRRCERPVTEGKESGRNALCRELTQGLSSK